MRKTDRGAFSRGGNDDQRAEWDRPVAVGSSYPTIEFCQAAEWPDVHGAFSLLYRSYLQRQLIKPNEIELRYTHYNLLPETATFVAKAEDRVIATLSAVVETKAFRLPMDQLYQGEADDVRQGGHLLAEGSGLAVDPTYQPIGMHLVMNLVKMAITYARKLDASYAVVACHPRHTRFYKRVFLFEEFGALRTYRAVNDAPAIALRLPLKNLEETYRAASAPEGDGIYRFFFSDEIFRCPGAALRAQAFSREIISKLCELQPAVARTLDALSPGMVRRLTGLAAPAFLPQEGERSAFSWDAPSIFIAA